MRTGNGEPVWKEGTRRWHREESITGILSSAGNCYVTVLINNDFIPGPSEEQWSSGGGCARVRGCRGGAPHAVNRVPCQGLDWWKSFAKGAGYHRGYLISNQYKAVNILVLCAS